MVLPGPAWALPFLISSLTPPFPKRPKSSRHTSATWCQGLGEAHIASLTLHSAPPVPVGYCHHGDQQVPPYHGSQPAGSPRLWGTGVVGVGRSSLQHRGLAHSTEDDGELTDTDQ